MTPDDIAHWQSWCAKPEWREEVLHGHDVLRLAEALNWDVEALGWPPLGHLALFLPLVLLSRMIEHRYAVRR